MSEAIAIKGIKDGLLISLDDREEWQSMMQQLATKLDEKAGFFAGARVTADIGERAVPKYDLTGLRALLERRKLTLVVVQSSSTTTLESATALDLRTSVPEDLRSDEPVVDDARPIDPEEQGTVGVMIKRTLRSGRTIHSRGHVLVYGDVNPGAQIIATGDIIVWGKLRGMVHAGAEGDESAVVCALDMSPNQLRIADLIVISPPEKNRKIRPEVASIQGDQIVVEAWG